MTTRRKAGGVEGQFQAAQQILYQQRTAAMGGHSPVVTARRSPTSQHGDFAVSESSMSVKSSAGDIGVARTFSGGCTFFLKKLMTFFGRRPQYTG